MQDYIIRQEYQRTNKEFMSEIKDIKNKINEIENAVLKLLEKITETMEKRYAIKPGGIIDKILGVIVLI